jgi:hypothetical protein
LASDSFLRKDFAHGRDNTARGCALRDDAHVSYTSGPWGCSGVTARESADAVCAA